MRLDRQSDRIVVFALVLALRLHFLSPRMKKRFRLSLDKRRRRLRAPALLPRGRRPVPDPPPSNLAQARVELAALRLAASLPMLPERTVDRFRRSLEKRRDWLELELSPLQIRPLSQAPRLWYFIGDLIDWLAAHAQLTGVGRVSTELFFAAVSAPKIHLYPCVLRNGTLRSASANELLTLSQKTGRVADSAGPDEGIEEVRAGDHVFFTGLAWTVPFVEAFKGLAARGIDFSVLIHDIIPIERPELVGDKQTRSFSDWLVTVVNTSNVIFVSSRRVESQIARWAVLSGLEIKALLVTIQFGLRNLGNTVLSDKQINEQTDKVNAGKFVLSVGTIDARKNQVLLCRVWHMLVDRTRCRSRATIGSGRTR